MEAGADALGLVARMPSGPGPIADEAIAEIAASTPPFSTQTPTEAWVAALCFATFVSASAMTK